MTAHFRPICWPFGDWESLFARLWSGRAQFDGICGSRSPPSPASIFLAGDFLYTKFCVQARVKPPPCGLCAGFRLNRRSWRRSERQRRVPVPHARTLEDETSLTAEPGQPDDGGDARRRARKEHTARQAERARQRRETDHRDSGDGRARAPRATDFGQRPKDAGGCAPAPAKITAWVRPPKGEARRGEGGSAPRARRGKGNDPTRNRAQHPAPPPTKRRNSRQRQRPEARRGRETGREAGRQPAEGTQNRARPAAKPPRPTPGKTASGRGSRPTPPHATARREPRQRTAKRRRDGRRRRRPGGNRTREPNRRPAASAEKKPGRTPQHARDRRGGREPRRPRAAARTHAGRGRVARTRRRPASRERNGPTPERRAGARKPGQGRRGKRQERRRAHRPAKRREQRERREPPARSWPAAAATLGREACAELCRQPIPCPLSCVFRVWVE